MKDFNQIALMGRITRDAELRYTASGSPICNFALAFTTSKKKGDQWEDQANFIDLALFGKTAENLNKYLTKGTQVLVAGSLEQQRWEKDGQKQSKIAMHVDEIKLIGGKRESSDVPRPQGQPEDAPAEYHDDIPF